MMIHEKNDPIYTNLRGQIVAKIYINGNTV